MELSSVHMPSQYIIMPRLVPWHFILLRSSFFSNLTAAAVASSTESSASGQDDRFIVLSSGFNFLGAASA